MAAPSDAQQHSLDALILAATNPLVKHEEPSAVQAVVQAVSRDPSAPATAVKILAHKIHSPQEREAMKALSVLQACIINCGPSFHAEIGKFKFLNEMIKLVSPKYAGNHTPPDIKSRVLELLFCWVTDLTHEPKIAEAYNMLKKQGVIKTDPVYIGPLRVTPSPRPAASSIEDSERSQQLQRLLQSKRPEDLDKANALIQAMVRDDQRRLERSTHTAMELEMARNNIKVLDEMLSEHEQRTCGSGHVALMTELQQTCTSLRDTLYHTIAQCSDTTTDMGDLISVNEELSRVIGRYKVLVEGRQNIGTETATSKDDAPHRKSDETSAAAANGARENSVSVETDKEWEGSKSSGKGVLDMLLDLTTPPQEKPVSAAATDLINHQLQILGLDDNQSPPPLASSSSTPVTSSSVTLLEALDGKDLFPSSTSPVGEASATQGVELLATPLRPQCSSTAVPGQPSLLGGMCDSQSNDCKSLLNPLDDLDVLSSSLLKSSLPPHTSTTGHHFKQPEKLSMNQLKLRQSLSLEQPTQAASSSLVSAVVTQSVIATTTSSSEVASTTTSVRNQRKEDNLNSLLLGDNLSSVSISDNSLGSGVSFSTKSMQQSCDSNSTALVQNKERGDSCDRLSSDFVKAVSDVSTADEALQRKEGGRQRGSVVPSSSSLSRAQFLEVKPLNDIKVSIENIEPGARAPLSLLQSGPVSTALYYTANAPRADVSVFVLTTTWRCCTAPLNQYVMQAVVPRACKVRLLPPSATQLPQYSPFLPPPAITQVMLVANPNQVNVSLKLMLSYSQDDDPVTEMAEVDNLEL